MKKTFNNLRILFVLISLYGCQASKGIGHGIIFIDCTHLSNTLGYVNGLIIKQDSILSCVKTNTIDKSIFRYSAFERKPSDFDNFMDNLTILADKHDQSRNKYAVDGESYTLIIKNDSIQKKYHFNSILMTDSLFEKIKIFKDYSKYLDFKPINKFTFPTNEMCIDTIPEPNPFG